MTTTHRAFHLASDGSGAAGSRDDAATTGDMDLLRRTYREGRLILFVGAGVSAGLGLPTWQELVNEMARQLGFPPAEFATYGDYRALAEYHRLRMGRKSILRWMADEWHKPGIDIGESAIHRLIVDGCFRRIYTTNFDRWIEAAHDAYGKEYVRVSNVRDLAKATDSVRQIIKFHGDFEEDDSIVLHETSYFDRLNFESPLDIKLRADLLDHSVLFIGYSISDTNIRLILYKLWRTWEQARASSDRPPSYWFSPQWNPVAQAVLDQWGIKIMASDLPDPGEALLRFMRDLMK